MDKLDKLSLLLLAGIIALIFTSSFIIYHSWIIPIDVTAEPSETPAFSGNLVFHEDTSVTNLSEGSVWIRAKLTVANTDEPNRTEDNCPNQDLPSISLANEFWEPSDDGWYYYALPLGKRQSTEPLMDRLSKYSGKSFHMQVELAPELWLYEKPINAVDAFNQISSVSL